MSASDGGAVYQARRRNMRDNFGREVVLSCEEVDPCSSKGQAMGLRSLAQWELSAWPHWGYADPNDVDSGFVRVTEKDSHYMDSGVGARFSSLTPEHELPPRSKRRDPYGREIFDAVLPTMQEAARWLLDNETWPGPWEYDYSPQTREDIRRLRAVANASDATVNDAWSARYGRSRNRNR